MFQRKLTRDERLQQAIDDAEKALNEALDYERKGHARKAYEAYEKAERIEREAANI